MHETIPNKVELKVNTTDSKKVEHDLACSMRSDDGERARFIDTHDLSHSTPFERLEQAKYDRPRERSPE